MSPILQMSLIVVAVFACAFGLCEFVAWWRAGGRATSPRFDAKREGRSAAARRRAAERVERTREGEGQ